MDQIAIARQRIAALDERIAALQHEVELARADRDAFVSFVELANRLFGEGHVGATAVAALPATTRAPTDTSTKARAIAAARAHIAANGPTRTREILSQLVEMGIKVGGANPVQALSAILSQSGMFAADRSKGWTLITHKEEPPRGAPTPKGVSEAHQSALAGAPGTATGLTQ